MTTPLTVYFNQNVSAELATGGLLASGSGGTVGTLATTLVGTASAWGEVWSQGNAGAWAAAGAMGSPTGHGWFLDSAALDGQQIDAGTWTASPGFKMSVNAAAMTADIWVNAYVYTAGVYTLIGSMSLLAQSFVLAATTYTFAGTSLPAGTFPTGSRLYLDIWLHITTPGTSGTGTVAVRQVTVASGLLGNVLGQVVTPGFDVTPPAATSKPRYIPRALGGTIIPVIVSQPLPYIGRALGSTIIYENRTFVPRALGGVYIPDTALWVKRALDSGALQVQPLAVTLAGVGTLTGAAPALSTALSTTFAGVGTLAGALSANLALPIVTLAGVGTLAGTLSLSTALTVEFDGIGTLVGTLSTTGNVSLAVTMAGVGTLTGTLSANTALTDTLAGVGTLTGAISLTTALASTLVGVGTLTGTLSMSVALSVLFAGVGTLSGTLSLPAAALLYLSATWLTRDGNQRWKTRDGLITWKTRDENAAWMTRDEKATWDTRDEQATWKTRQ